MENNHFWKYAEEPSANLGNIKKHKYDTIR